MFVFNFAILVLLIFSCPHDIQPSPRKRWQHPQALAQWYGRDSFWRKKKWIGTKIANCSFGRTCYTSLLLYFKVWCFFHWIFWENGCSSVEYRDFIRVWILGWCPISFFVLFVLYFFMFLVTFFLLYFYICWFFFNKIIFSVSFWRGYIWMCWFNAQSV
jgi:hypothetical protein